MSEEDKKAHAKKVKRSKILTEAFDKQPDEIVIFDPKKEGEFVIGKIADYGISKEFSTPFLVLLDENGEEITVFMKMGIIPKMRRKKWITIEDTWLEKTVEDNMGKMIAFQFIEKAESEKTKREFQKYKIMFSDDLEKEGITGFD